MRNWSIIIKPDDFSLLTGEDNLGDYQSGKACGHHLFFKHCRVRLFGRVNIEETGGDHGGIQLATLDNVELAELVHSSVKFANGRDNSWWTEPAETRHL